jgi:integrase
MNEYVQTIELSKGNERTKAYATARYNNWLRDSLGKMKLKDITRVDIENYFDEVLVGYSGSLKRKILTHISTIFKYATADGLVNRNPALAVHIDDDKRVNEPNPLTREQFHEFIDLWDNDKVLVEHANFIVAMGYLGCRPQELGALTWDNVDLEERTVYIRQAIKKDAKGNNTLGS